MNEEKIWGNSLENMPLSLFLLLLFLKPEKMTGVKCSVRFAEECEFFEAVKALSLPSEFPMAQLLSYFFASFAYT